MHSFYEVNVSRLSNNQNLQYRQDSAQQQPKQLAGNQYEPQSKHKSDASVEASSTGGPCESNVSSQTSNMPVDKITQALQEVSICPTVENHVEKTSVAQYKSVAKLETNKPCAPPIAYDMHAYASRIELAQLPDNVQEGSLIQVIITEVCSMQYK